LVLERGKAKLSARFRENKRQKVVNSVDMDERTIRIGWFEKINFSEKGLTESQRREQEFRVMRRVQEKAERHRRYSALAISTAASMTLWLVGAVVFMKAEKPQGWSYFVSLYFAYTSLLTIGYGDFTVASNSGKAFFVFWSLLAVPTLTILISNMGDTVIKEFKDLTIWIGSLTVLPDEQGVSAAIKLALKRIQHGKLYKPRDEKDNSSDTTKDSMLDRLAEHTEDEELGEAEKAGEQGDFLQRDIHFYHYVLAKEIRQLMRDVNAQPPKQYTFQEWTYYLRLVGEDEDDSSRHRRPKNNPKHRRGKQKTPDIGAATGGEDENGEQFTWSWLGIRSPLMGNSTEAQWLLHKLTLALEEEMRKMRSPNKEVRDEKPPITMAGLKNRTSSEQTDPEKLLEKGMGSGEVRRRGRAN
jgi:potassium channel subfamily K